MLKQFYGTIVVGSAIAVVVTACDGQPASTSVAAPTAAPTSAASSATEAPHVIFATEIAPTAAAPTAAPAVAVPTAAPTVAAPTAAPTSAASSATQAPRFTHPTEITNPFYPVSLTGKAIFLGTEGEKPSRTEVTLLPVNKMIAGDGQQIEARVLQFVAYADGKLVEIAYDYFAQADDGSVYYLGEDVSNYEDGKLVDHGGSWLAGKDGAPAALIMPAHPEVGQVFNPENLPGVVYETDEVLSLAEKTTTPAGSTDKGMLVKEILMDGSIEYKVYAANFGIVEDRAEDEQDNLVLFNRTDAKPGTVPESLDSIEVQAEDIFDLVPGGDWKRVTADVTASMEAWQMYRTQAANDHVPQAFQDALTVVLDHLQETAAVKDAAGTMQAANDLSAAVLDLFTVYHPTTPTDVGWLDVLERQVLLDVAANDFTAAADSLAKTNAVWARLKPVILAHNGSDVATQFENSLTTQQEALNKENASALTAAATNGLELVDALEKLF
jgi:hypothetical protein